MTEQEDINYYKSCFLFQFGKKITISAIELKPEEIIWDKITRMILALEGGDYTVVFSKSRRREVAELRHIILYILHTRGAKCVPLGELYDIHYTSILFAKKVVKTQMLYDQMFRERVRRISEYVDKNA